MFDALQDTPRDFQFKLMDALNSLGQTMEIPPTECFDKVLCASDDENPDVKKTMYNWWRAFFEVLGKVSDGKMPKVRVSEYNEKIDALMAEIMKAGDKEASGDNEVVLEDGYEEADKTEEDEMNKDFDFAVQHIGEIANKVKDIVNFVNPYCEASVNELGDQPKFKEGDVVKVRNVSGMDFHGRDAPIGTVLEIKPPHPDVGVYEYLIKGRSGEFFAYENELEPMDNFTEEVKKNTMKFNKIDERVGGDSDEWVSMDAMIGMEVGESEEHPGEFQVGDKGMWKDPEYDKWTDGWTVISGPEEGFDVYDDMYTIENDDGSEAEVLGCELRLVEMMKEDGESEPSPAEDFLDKVLEDAEDTNDVFEVYDGTVLEDNEVVLNVNVYKDDVDDWDVKEEFKTMPRKYGWEYEGWEYSSDVTGGDNTEILVYFKKSTMGLKVGDRV